jgi:hypothetical protein
MMKNNVVPTPLSGIRVGGRRQIPVKLAPMITTDMEILKISLFRPYLSKKIRFLLLMLYLRSDTLHKELFVGHWDMTS